MIHPFSTIAARRLKSHPEKLYDSPCHSHSHSHSHETVFVALDCLSARNSAPCTCLGRRQRSLMEHHLTSHLSSKSPRTPGEAFHPCADSTLSSSGRPEMEAQHTAVTSPPRERPTSRLLAPNQRRLDTHSLKPPARNISTESCVMIAPKHLIIFEYHLMMMMLYQ